MKTQKPISDYINSIGISSNLYDWIKERAKEKEMPMYLYLSLIVLHYKKAYERKHKEDKI